jgi:hypothetical protein
MSIEQKIKQMLAESSSSDEQVIEEETIEEAAADGKSDGVTKVSGANPDSAKNDEREQKTAQGGTSKKSNAVHKGASAPEASHITSVKSDGVTTMAGNNPDNARKGMKEDIDALFEGDEQLSEEFKEKAGTIFEAAVIMRVNEEVQRIEEEFETKLHEAVEEIKEGLVEKVDGYLDYIVEQWMKENEIALESGMKSDILEGFVSGLKDLFKENYVEIPEEKMDVLGEMEQHIYALEEKLSETVEKNIMLSKQLDEAARQQSIEEIAEGLTDTQVEKFKDLAEELSFENQDSFTKKLQTIRENYFSEKKSSTQQLLSSVVSDEAVTIEEDKIVDPTIKSYMQALSSFKK